MAMRTDHFAAETTMKRWACTLLAVLALAAIPRPAHAVGPVIDWDPLYFWMPGATFSNMPGGGVMQGVGTVAEFGPPLDFLNATMPATEYTFYINGLLSQGTSSFGPPANTIYQTVFNGGTCPGLFTGGATWSTAPGVGIPGYLFRHDGKIDLQCPVPTQKSTWGRVKQMYR